MTSEENSKSVELGNFLKQARVDAGLSQIEVAKQFGYGTSQFISNWERGISAPPVDIVKRLADLYKVEPEALFDLVLQSSIERMTANMNNRYSGKKQG